MSLFKTSLFLLCFFARHYVSLLYNVFFFFVLFHCGRLGIKSCLHLVKSDKNILFIQIAHLAKQTELLHKCTFLQCVYTVYPHVDMLVAVLTISLLERYALKLH